MDIITTLITENADVVANALFVLCGSFIAKLYVMFTETKDKPWYKLLEALALVFGKVKQKAEDNANKDSK